MNKPIYLKLPELMIEKLDYEAAAQGVPRASVIKGILYRGLASEDG